MGYSPWGLKESDITEGTEHACTCVLTHTHTHTITAIHYTQYTCQFICDIKISWRRAIRKKMPEKTP